MRSVTPERVTSTLPSPPPTDKKIKKMDPPFSSDIFTPQPYDVLTPLSKFRELEAEVHSSFPSLSSQVQSLSHSLSSLRDSSSLIPSFKTTLDSFNARLSSTISTVETDHKIIQQSSLFSLATQVETLEDQMEQMQTTIDGLLSPPPAEYWTRSHLSSLGFQVVDALPADGSLSLHLSHLRVLFPGYQLYVSLPLFTLPPFLSLDGFKPTSNTFSGKVLSSFCLSSDSRVNLTSPSLPWLKTRAVACLADQRFYLSPTDYAYMLVHHCYQWLYLFIKINNKIIPSDFEDSCKYSLPVPNTSTYLPGAYHINRGGITKWSEGLWQPFFTSELLGAQLVKQFAARGRKLDFYLQLT